MRNTTDLLVFYYGEHPSAAASWIAMGLYLAITLVIFVQTIKTKCRFMHIVVITGLLEAGGFLFRGLMINDPLRRTYILTQCLLIISPVLFAIAEYMLVGRLLQRTEIGRNSFFAKWEAKLFTLSDLFCLVLQGAGGASMSGNTQKEVDMGRNLLLAGLFLQLGFFSLFTFLTVRAHRSPEYGFTGNPKLKPMFFSLYAKIVLMYIRNIFRVVEFIQGFDGYLASHEIFFYMFDFVPLYTCCILYVIFPYGYYVGPKGVLADGTKDQVLPTMNEYPQTQMIASSATTAVPTVVGTGGV